MPEEALLDTKALGGPEGPGEDTAEPAGEDLGDWNENLDEKLQDTLKKMAQHVCDEFRYPRRLEVMKSWQARSFWREMQHLKWNWEGQAWECLGGPGNTVDGTKVGDYDSSLLYSTNIFQGFGDSFIAIITQAVPSLRFEPEDPDEAADIETARACEPLRTMIQHENDPIELMTKAAYYGWCDGRMHGWTRWEVDKRTGKPRETQSMEGAMEVKVPTIADKQEDFMYLQFSKEYNVATVRAKVKARAFSDPLYYKKIKGGSTGNGQDVYERTARISVMQGISIRSAGGDTYAHLCTTQRTWFRPEAFLMDCVPEDQYEPLQSLFPTGCYVEFDNGTYTGSRDANMDDEWAVENIMEGDGQFRNGKGTCLLSVQERANDIINITQDVYEKLLPASHWDDKLFDLDAMRKQRSQPGARYGINFEQLAQGDALPNHVFYEPPATVSADMLTYLKELMTDIPQFLTGISAILFGADQSGDKSGKALSIQQNAAMGRVGLPFRRMKRMYAKMMEQAVYCAARNRQDDMRQGIPDQYGNVETLVVRIGDLNGKVRCYADSDENYPESWTQKRATYLQLLQEGNTDPAMRATLAKPKNQELGKKLIGLSELEISGADSWNKQMQEINLLLNEVPPPPQPVPPIQAPNPLTGDMETLPQPPKITSSIPIQKYDDNAAEFQTCVDWINSPNGQKMRKENATGFTNVELHADEHKQALAAMMPKAPPPMMPPPKPAGAHPPAKPPAAAPAPAGAPA